MTSLYLLIPIAIIFVSIAVLLFFWAINNGQFDDMDGPAHSILFEEIPTNKEENQIADISTVHKDTIGKQQSSENHKFKSNK